jgi:DNA polymerase elongation subunit (family B)
MVKAIGWFLDTYIQEQRAVLWLMTSTHQVLALTDTYSPSFFLLPKNDTALTTLIQRAQTIPHIEATEITEKRVELGHKPQQRVLHVTVDHVKHYKPILNKLEVAPEVRASYNTDLLHVQRYLFTQLGVAPSRKVEIEYTTDKRMIKVTPVDDAREIAPPPFRTLIFDAHTKPSGLTRCLSQSPIAHIHVRYGDQEQTLYGDELTLLEKFAMIVETVDPDILVCPTLSQTIAQLTTRSRRLQLHLPLGRHVTNVSGTTPRVLQIPGRVGVSYRDFRACGLAGLIERARFSVLPLGIAAQWSANRVIDSRNCFELAQQGYVIPKNKGGYEYIRRMDNVIDRDRGGIILAPQIGQTHANVAELDFESQYPHLIVSYGLSYETVTPDGVDATAAPLLAHVTKGTLDRRLWFKRYRQHCPRNSVEWQWCEQRQLALKMILVCLYGTSGCCWNRFGNVLCFEEINRRSRKVIVQTKNLAQQNGFEVIYADTDSLFVKKPTATRADYDALSQKISRHIELPIALDHHYKFLLLLPLELDPSGVMEAQKRYFGLLTDGQLVTRGIEIRRHDCPRFIKTFQTQLIRHLFGVNTVNAVKQEGLRSALSYIHQTLDAVARHEVTPEELIISKILRKPLATYTQQSPHVAAARNLVQQGQCISDGDVIDFIYVNAQHPNPLRRIIPTDLYEAPYYDAKKYQDLILDAAETVLATFGFSRHLFLEKIAIDMRDQTYQKKLLKYMRSL